MAPLDHSASSQRILRTETDDYSRLADPSKAVGVVLLTENEGYRV